MSDHHYQGTELGLFEKANNWKTYWGRMVMPFLGKRVLEVGAGIGGTTQFLNTLSQTYWLCLEPDRGLLNIIQDKIVQGDIRDNCTTLVGTIADLDPDQRFDSVLYIDVLEHIERDEEELKQVSHFLETGGHLIVLVPAHQKLFSPFDAAIGHYRRYGKRTLKSVLPDGFQVILFRYLDSCGLAASFLNRALLRQSYPTVKQIEFWDRVLITGSRLMDRFFSYRIGKSLLLIAKKG